MGMKRFKIATENDKRAARLKDKFDSIEVTIGKVKDANAKKALNVLTS